MQLEKFKEAFIKLRLYAGLEGATISTIKAMIVVLKGMEEAMYDLCTNNGAKAAMQGKL